MNYSLKILNLQLDDEKQSIVPFIHPQRPKQLLVNKILRMYLNQSTLRLNQP